MSDNDPTFTTNTFWTRVVLSDQRVREETLRALARAWVEDPAAVAEHLGLLAETADHADAFSSACLDAEADLNLGSAETELSINEAEALHHQLAGALGRVYRATPPRAVTHLPAVPPQTRKAGHAA